MFVKSTQDVDIWMEIPIKDDVYIWANYSVSCYRLYKRLNMIEIRFYATSFVVLGHIFFETTAQIPEVKFGGKHGFLRANTDIRGLIRRANNQHWLLAIIGHAKTNVLQQNMW